MLAMLREGRVVKSVSDAEGREGGSPSYTNKLPLPLTRTSSTHTYFLHLPHPLTLTSSTPLHHSHLLPPPVVDASHVNLDNNDFEVCAASVWKVLVCRIAARNRYAGYRRGSACLVLIHMCMCSTLRLATYAA